MRTYKAFTEPSPYEIEKQRAERQRRYAELLQQQAMEGEQEPFTFQGFRAMPSPANALGRILQAYTAKKVGEKAEASEAKAREADIAGMTELQRSLGPQTRVVEPDMFADPMEMASKYTPPRTETTMPTFQQRESLLTNALASGTPSSQRLAQLMLSRQPQVSLDALMEASEESRRKYEETGDPSVLRKPAKPAESLIGKPSPSDFTPESLAKFSQTGNFQDLVAIPKQPLIGSIDLSPKDTFRFEADLRNELKDKLKEYEAVRNSYQKIENALNTGAGDIAVVYAFAKLNDPTSVVRESEFETVAKSGSLGQRIKNLVEQAQTGKMNPQLRENLRQQARQMYLSQQTNAENIVNQYRELAISNDLNPNKVLAGINVSNLIWSEDDEKELQRLRNKAQGRQ